MNPTDLITDAGTGQTSHTKLWANVAYATATFIAIWMTLHDKMTVEMMLTYLGCVGTSATVSKFLSLRYGLKTTP